ncbi:Hsp70 family protein [Nonomuraea zeae]|nr:Hsp70 family protein [Nonomuraea zeae]
MAESRAPALAVDFGTTSSTALLVAPAPASTVTTFVKDPVNGQEVWPSSVFQAADRLLVGAMAQGERYNAPGHYRDEIKRYLGQDDLLYLGDDHPYRPEELVTAVLGELRAAAQASQPHAIERVICTVPASYGPSDRRRELMIWAAGEAGFTDVELLAEPIAAALSPGLDVADGGLVLVYDFGGGTFDTALVRYSGDGRHTVVASQALDDCGGRDLDVALVRAIDVAGLAMSEAELAGQTAGLALKELARRAKHRLAGLESVTELLSPGRPPVVVTRAALLDAAAPLIDRTVACCQELLRRTGTRARDVRLALLVGGSSRLVALRERVERQLGIPCRPAANPDTAVASGAAQWAARSGERRIAARARAAHVEPLTWPLTRADLVRTLVQPGDAYGEGASLARVRLPDGTLHDLAAGRPGVLLAWHATAGQPVFGGDWLASTLALPGPAELDPRPLWQVPGRALAAAWFPDARRLATAWLDGSVRLLDAASGEVTAQADGGGHVYGIAVSPDGTRVAYGANDARHRLQMTDGDLRPLWESEQDGVVFQAAFSPSGERVVAGCGDGAIGVWSSWTGRRERVLPQPGRTRLVAFLADERRLLACGQIDRWAARLTVWDVADGDDSASVTVPTQVRGLGVTGEWALVCDPAPSGARLFRLPRLEPAASTLTGSYHCLAADRHAGLIALGADESVLIADGRTGRTAAEIPASGARALAFGLAGHALAVIDADGLSLWTLTAWAAAGRDREDLT